MPRGGHRDGSGRKPKDGQPRPVRAITAPVRPRAKPHRSERIRRVKGRLDPLQVMQENMQFYHEEAGKILATIMMMPVGEGGLDRVEALMKFADVAKMRASSQAVAVDLAKYIYHPKGAQPYTPDPDDPGAGEGGGGKVIEHSQLDEVLWRFTGARQPAAAAKVNGSGLNGGGHNGANGHG